MKKNLLIALALPAMFAACSQEEIIDEGKVQAGMLGTPAGEINFLLNGGADSRLVWGATGNPAWDEAGDAFSLFWVGAAGENTADGVYQSATNALYLSEDGSEFTSKNIVYEGKHFIVYPADYNHTSNKKVLVKVGAEQKAEVALGERSVYVSELLEIKARPENESDRKADVMYAGYGEPVVADVSALSSNMVLKLNFSMNENINEVQIKSIQLKSNNEIFAYEGNLRLDKNEYMSLVPTATGNVMTLLMPAGTKVTKSSPTYTAQISLLPPVAEKLSGATYEIIIKTNFGVVTIDKALSVTNSAGKYQIAAGVGYNPEVTEITKDTELSFQTEFSDIAVRDIDNAGTPDIDESESSYGKRFTRNVAVDMSKAVINGMEIANSQDLIDAYQVYDLLGKGKDDNVSFTLVGEAWKDGAEKQTFDLNTVADAAIAAHEYVTLELGEKCDTLALVNTAGAFAAVPDLSKALGENREQLHLNLCEGNWALNVKDAKLVNAYKEIHNLGTLTITETTVTGGIALSTVVCNEGETTFSGTTVNMPVAYNQTKTGNTVVGADTKVNLNAGGSISGKARIEGKFAANKGLVNIASDAKLTVSGSLLTAATGTMNNLGAITLEGSGTTIVSANQEGDDMGSIVLADRTSMAKVNDSDKQGYIKWIYQSGGTFTKNLTDAFNCLVLKSNITFYQDQIGDNIKHIEIANSKVSVLPYYTYYGAKVLTVTLNSVLIDENCTFIVPVGTEIKTEATVKNGDIEVYGTYVAGEETGDGTIYYFNKQVNVATEKALVEAVESETAEIVVLESDIQLTDRLCIKSEKTINLNGKTLRAGKAYDETQDMAAAIVVAGGNVVIEGEGEVSGGEGNQYNMAIRADGGVVTIKGGNFVVGDDVNGNPNTVVYATGEAKVCIEGGYFAYEGTETSTEYLLNIKDKDVNNASITVTGGTFKNFNPAQNNAESATKSFVKEGYKVRAFDKEGNKLNDNTTTNYKESKRGKAGEAVTYEVYSSAE